MQALEDLKTDIQSLIDATADTITSLVDEMARRAKATPDVSTSAGVPATSSTDGGEFTSEIEALRVKVRAATDNLKQQAKVALENVGSVSGSTSGSTSPAPAPQPVDPTINPGTTAQGNTDDQFPAGGKDTGTPIPPPPSPVDQPSSSGSTIGPDSFKSGA